ncbi:HNH endonuclease signature motif containing protein [Planctomonas psychrotolerans]|uniref:HNH endonuclease signature motif containing protein n=1 Tax=Planctomonas psychrotolerans TaxID=2528712 RepID=UPI00123B7031|nr:HNH endonuclease signature motif containing protein [Planctomonas psychrotolerans]
MDPTVEALTGIADAITDTLPCDAVAGLDDVRLLAVVRAVEAVGRRVDALRVTVAAEVAERSRKPLGSAGLAARCGCRTPAELLQRTTLASASTLYRRVTLGAAVRPRVSLTGDPLPARFDRVGAAFRAGTIGVDTASAITGVLGPLHDRVAADSIGRAEEELVAAATGSGPDTPVPAGADEVRVQAVVWQAFLHPDGVEEAEEEAMRHRYFSIGRHLHRGLVPMKLLVLPEAAGRVEKFFDAHLTPTQDHHPEGAATGDTTDAKDTIAAVPGETRSRDQQRHDVFIALIDTLARTPGTPQVGGAAPTVLVTVHADDLAQGRTVGFSDGVETPLSATTVEQMICTGGTQNVVLAGNGRVLALGSPERCFTPRQRRAITARDGGCIIPGCPIPATWCEIHHVVPAAEGGPTHTDNGVLLCWFHHRTITTSGWRIRMHHGATQVQPPPWINPNPEWRPASRARTTRNTRMRHGSPTRTPSRGRRSSRSPGRTVTWQESIE